MENVSDSRSREAMRRGVKCHDEHVAPPARYNVSFVVDHLGLHDLLLYAWLLRVDCFVDFGTSKLRLPGHFFFSFGTTSAVSIEN